MLEKKISARNDRYQVEEILGQNLAGGRVTYKARSLESNTFVVIKQFQFARGDSDWNHYNQLQSEITTLKQLQHPGIPRYLDSFETDNGFCLVQEYKNARQSSGSYTYKEVKQIAIGILKILVYLQQPHLSIIHRDIKPENILVGEELDVFLVDFGFAKNNDRGSGASSVVKGTLGFMPPEQILGRKLDFSSDLYSLGVTLIALLTGTESSNIEELFDCTLALDLKKINFSLDRNFKKWLEKLIERDRKKRFSNAKVALHSLQNLESISASKKIGRARKIVRLKNKLLVLFGNLGSNFSNILELDGESLEAVRNIIILSFFFGIPIALGGKFALLSVDLLSSLGATASFDKGNEAYLVKDYSSAITYYDRSISKLQDKNGELIVPDLLVLDDFAEQVLVPILFKRGNSYSYLKEYQSAIEDYDRAIQISPNNAKLYYNRGWVRVALNDLDLALADFERAIQIDPDYTSAIKNRSIVTEKIKCDRSPTNLSCVDF